MKVAIIGLGPTYSQAPFYDPDWELWGLPWHDGYWIHYDRLFEMHDLALLTSTYSTRPKNYLERLKSIDVPLYMQEEYFFNVTPYPFDQITPKYWNSSIAYMIALAIHENAEEIAVYGVDMKGDDEYGYQKPNIEYLLGLAEGRGIKVTIPEESPLLKFNDSGIWFCNCKPRYQQRYGNINGNHELLNASN